MRVSLLRICFYCQLFMLVIVLLMLISFVWHTGNNTIRFDNKLSSQSYDGLVIGINLAMAAYVALGLWLNVVLRRNAETYTGSLFWLLSGLYFVFFMLPPLVMIIRLV